MGSLSEVPELLALDCPVHVIRKLKEMKFQNFLNAF